MEGCTVIEIIEQYLEWELVKYQRGYSSALRLQYDNDAKYYLEKGYLEEEALHADTVISFWTLNNSQIRSVINDADVHAFYLEIVKNAKFENEVVDDAKRLLDIN